MRIPTLSMLVALVLGGGAPALGAMLATAPIDKDGFSTVECSIVNVGKKERTVKIEVWLAGATPPESSPVVSLRPNDYWRWSGGGCSDGCVYYCRFIVQGGKKDFRAGGCVKPQGGGCAFFVPAQ